MDDDKIWTIGSSLAAIVAAALIKKAMAKGWEIRRGSVAGIPRTEGNSWGEALVWAAISGVVIGIVRLIAEEGFAEVLERQGRTLSDKARTVASA